MLLRPPTSTLFPYTTLFRSPRIRLHRSESARVSAGQDPHQLVVDAGGSWPAETDRKSTRLNSSHSQISYAVFCLKKKKRQDRSADNTCTQSDRSHPQSLTR